jgi:putative nucleotidyltransferase with HDIG domain
MWLMTGKVGITRRASLGLLEKHVKADSLVKHCLATEAIMRALARRLGGNEEAWGTAGLLHDLDFEDTKDSPRLHGLKTAQTLASEGVDSEVIESIKAHNAEALGIDRNTTFAHALAAAETITGLIVATALVYPDRKLASVKPSSVTKRMKKKDFARAVNRDIIMECEQIGLSLPQFAELSLKAMQDISDELGL